MEAFETETIDIEAYPQVKWKYQNSQVFLF